MTPLKVALTWHIPLTHVVCILSRYFHK